MTHLPRRLALICALATLSGCAMTPPSTGQDGADIARAETYLNALTRLTARFTQTGADGFADGLVWLERPGRLRVEYLHPRPRTLLVNHGRLMVADHLNGAVTTMPVSRTPLDILLAQDIRLSGKVRVASVQRAPGLFALSLVKADAPSEGQLTLEFTAQPLSLYGLTVQLPNGGANTLTLQDVLSPAAIDPSRFTYQPGS